MKCNSGLTIENSKTVNLTVTTWWGPHWVASYVTMEVQSKCVYIHVERIRQDHRNVLTLAREIVYSLIIFLKHVDRVIKTLQIRLGGQNTL